MHDNVIGLGIMKPIVWNQDKNEWLKVQRQVSFEQVSELILKGKFIDNFDHPNQDRYPGQKEFAIKLNDYVYLVPYVEDSEKIFLKTVIPSRKATKKYGR